MTLRGVAPARQKPRSRRQPRAAGRRAHGRRRSARRPPGRTSTKRRGNARPSTSTSTKCVKCAHHVCARAAAARRARAPPPRCGRASAACDERRRRLEPAPPQLRVDRPARVRGRVADDHRRPQELALRDAPAVRPDVAARGRRRRCVGGQLLLAHDGFGRAAGPAGRDAEVRAAVGDEPPHDLAVRGHQLDRRVRRRAGAESVPATNASVAEWLAASRTGAAVCWRPRSTASTASACSSSRRASSYSRRPAGVSSTPRDDRVEQLDAGELLERVQALGQRGLRHPAAAARRGRRCRDRLRHRACVASVMLDGCGRVPGTAPWRLRRASRR